MRGVSGASSGIGAATAVLFARLGAKLAITGRNSDNLQKVSDECAKQPGATKLCNGLHLNLTYYFIH